MMKDDPDPSIVIDVAVPCAAWRRRLPAIVRVARDTAMAVLAGFKLGDAELSLVLTDDVEIKALNSRWRGKDSPTNVLSFASDAKQPVSNAPRMLGDVVLAFETVAREADEQGKPFADHTRHLIVHGVLHLLGHDHEASREAERMEKLERRILAGLGISDPYRVTDEIGHD
jgi:probable rRNA maturation factor